TWSEPWPFTGMIPPQTSYRSWRRLYGRIRPPGGGDPSVCGVALCAAVGVVSTPHTDAPAAEAEDPGSVADLASRAGGAATRPLCGGRPALDRSLDPRVPHPAGGPGANGPTLDSADLSARVSAALGLAHASHPHGAAAPAPVPGGSDDCTRDRG